HELPREPPEHLERRVALAPRLERARAVGERLELLGHGPRHFLAREHFPERALDGVERAGELALEVHEREDVAVAPPVVPRGGRLDHALADLLAYEVAQVVVERALVRAELEVIRDGAPRRQLDRDLAAAVADQDLVEERAQVVHVARAARVLGVDVWLVA